MSNPNGLKGFGNAKGNDIDSGLRSPDAMVMPSGSNSYYQKEAAEKARKEKRDAEKKEREKKTRRFKRFLGGAAVVAATAGVVLAADKEPNKPMEQTAWEEAMRKEAAGHNAHFYYDEEGSTITFNDSFNGVSTEYTFFDDNDDAYIERAHSSNQNGGADLAFSETTTFAGALDQINAKMNAEN